MRTLRAQARHNGLEGVQQLLLLTEKIPSAQLRRMMQAACLDVAASIEELSTLDLQRQHFAEKPQGSSGEVA